MKRSLAILCLALLLLLAGGFARADCPERNLTPVRAVKAGEAAEGETVLVRGVVTGDYRGNGQLNGFYLQSMDEDPYGVFVYAPGLDAGSAPIRPGREVLVAGRADRYRGQRQVSRVSQVLACGEPGLPEPQPLALPDADRDGWQHHEGLLVRVPEPLTVTGNWELGVYGSLQLSIGGRLFHRDPNADTGHPARRLVLDDGSYQRDPDPVPYLDEDGTRRAGSRITGLEGILTHAFDAWRLHPLAPDEVAFRDGNPRQPAPARAGRARVAAFNVENYFRTLGERGAETAEALQAQRRALAAVFADLGADVIGLQEVENRRRAVEDLTRLLDEAPGDYRHLALDHPVGSDEIRSVLAWRADKVELLAGPFLDESGVHARPPLAALFRLHEDDPGTLVAVVHHKSRSSCPSDGDTDRGEGCWSERRTEQSRAVQTFLEEIAKEEGIDRILVIGDINSYAHEAPRTAFTEEGWVDLAERVPAPQRYSYIYRGAAGVLDTAIASPALADQVEAVHFWPINADEPRFLRHQQPGPWRSADHDPVIVDID